MGLDGDQPVWWPTQEGWWASRAPALACLCACAVIAVVVSDGGLNVLFSGTDAPEIRSKIDSDVPVKVSKEISYDCEWTRSICIHMFQRFNQISKRRFKKSHVQPSSIHQDDSGDLPGDELE